MKSIFVVAIQIADRQDRAAYLDSACGADRQLRETVERLLAARDQDDANPLDRALEDIRPEETAGAAEDSGGSIDVAAHPMIGCYKILERLGEGGMGVVYMAEQQHPIHRKVALKVIKPGMDTRIVVARFQAEQQALAMMEHPHIAKVFDAGTTRDNRPYFVMELVRGVAITDFCTQHRLNARQRLELLAKVCRAVQHTHQKGVIHRDLKPSNVMVEMHNTEAVPKIIDFGVAKATQQPLTDQTLFTRFVQMIGTPLYMSPEQAELNALDVDTRSDVYSLGVLLYELLTGQTPFDRERIRKVGYDELRQIIRFEEPPRPSSRLSTLNAAQQRTLEQIHGLETPQIVRRLRGELDWIVMKALEKDRTRRYESAAALTHDIENYLSGDPVSARPPSTLYQVSKFARRHKGVLASSIAVLAALLIGIAASLWYAWQTKGALDLADQRLRVSNAALATAERARGDAEAAIRRSRLLLYLADMKLASDAHQIGDTPRVVSLLERHVPVTDEEDLRGFEWYYLHKLVDTRPVWKQDLGSPVHSVCYSPQGDRMAVATRDGQIRVYGSRTGQLLRTYISASRTNDVTWDPTGKRIVAAFADGTIRIWQAPSATEGSPKAGGPGQPRRDLASVVLNNPDLSWTAHEGETNAVRLTPDGNTILSCGDDGVIRTWAAATGQPGDELEGHQREVEAIACSPDGTLVASASSDTTLGLWDLDSGARTKTWELPGGGRVVAVAFAPDGSLIAAGDIDGNLLVTDPASGAIATVRQLDGIESVRFLDSRQHLATGDRSGAIHVWTAERGPEDEPQLHPREASLWQAHAGRVLALSGSPRAGRMASGSLDGEIAVWNAAVRASWQSDSAAEDFAAGEGGALIVCDHELHQLDIEHRRWVASMVPNAARWENIARSDDGSRIAVAAVGMVAVVDAHSGEPLAHWEIDHDPNAIDISPDGRRVAVAWWDEDDGIDLLDVEDPQQHWRLAARQCECLSFSPDGSRLAAGEMDDLLLYNLDTRECEQRFTGHDSTLSAVAFSPDGRTVASVGHDRRLKVWDTATGRMLHSVEAHRQRVRSVAFSNDGKRIVTCGEDGAARLWHAETAQPVLEIRVGTRLDKVRFADRDRQLVVLLHDRQILVYSVSPPSAADESREMLSVEAELLGLGLTPVGDDFPPMAISVDGQVVVGHALLDDKSTPFRWTEADGMRPLPVPDAYPHVYAMSADADGRRVAGRFVTPDRVTLLGRWDGNGPPPVIEPLPEGWRQILVQGMRGSSIAGYGFKQNDRQRCAFVFDGRRFCELPAFGERKNAAALTVCGEEGLVIGTAWSRNGPSQSRATRDLRVVRWLDGSEQLLPGFGPEAYNWRATACSADGTVVVGHRWPVGTTPLDGAGLAFRWENGIAETLGELFGGGIQSVAHAVSADGRCVVGSSWTESGPTAFVWDRQHGMRRLEEVLRQQGADLRGWHLEYALAISADGTHIAGHGRNPADAPEIFLARISVD